MTRAPSSPRIAATVLLPAPIPPVSPTTGAAIAAVAVPTRAASRGSRRPRAIEARASLPHEARQPPPSDRAPRRRGRVGGGRPAPGLPARRPPPPPGPRAPGGGGHDEPLPLPRPHPPRPRGVPGGARSTSPPPGPPAP